MSNRDPITAIPVPQMTGFFGITEWFFDGDVSMKNGLNTSKPNEENTY